MKYINNAFLGTKLSDGSYCLAVKGCDIPLNNKDINENAIYAIELLVPEKQKKKILRQISSDSVVSLEGDLTFKNNKLYIKLPDVYYIEHWFSEEF